MIHRYWYYSMRLVLCLDWVVFEEMIVVYAGNKTNFDQLSLQLVTVCNRESRIDLSRLL